MNEKIQEYLKIMKDLLEEIERELNQNSNSGEREGKKFYTIQEFAEMTGLHPSTIWKNIQSGKIPAKRLGKKYFIPASFFGAPPF
jgi:excisionase family DNA binding protein